MFNIADVETSTASLMLQVTSSNQSLLPFTSISLSGLGTTSGNIDLHYQPSANKYGDVRLTFRLSDGFVVTQNQY